MIGVPTRVTRLVGAAVDSQPGHVLAGPPVREEIGKVVEGRPTVIDRGRQDGFYRWEQAFQVGNAETPAGNERWIRARCSASSA